MAARELIRILCVVGVTAAVCPQIVVAQLRVSPFDADDPGSMLVPRDRRLQSLVDQAQRELNNPEGDHREALLILQRLLDEADDVFVDASMQLSMRQQTSNILAALPAPTKTLYQELFQDEAAALLQSSDRGSTRVACRTIVRRFFHTAVGAEAAFRLAAEDMDAGRFLAAARLFARIRSEHHAAGVYEPALTVRCVLSHWRAGAEGRAADVLLDATNTNPELVLTNSEQRVPSLRSRQEALQWLSEQLGRPAENSVWAANHWLTPHGTAHRNPSSDPISPLFDDAWSVPLIRDHDAEDPLLVEELATLLDGVSQAAHLADWTTIPVLTPLVTGNLVVFPSYGHVKAVDVATGELQWAAVPADQTYLDSLRSSTRASSRRLASEMKDFLVQRAWLDATSSQISSDGARVYLVRDAGMIGGIPQQFVRAAPLNHPRGPKSFNSLRAYDVVGGNWLWEIGGARTRVSLPLAGSFFLGPPLEVDGSLYVLGEDLGQVRLHSLDPESGNVRWSLPLVNAANDVEDAVERRLAGLSPTSAGGLLICPTGGGLVVAVDPVTRSLVWGSQYREPEEFRSSQGVRMRGPFMAVRVPNSQMTSVNSLMKSPRWHDGCIVAAGRSVLATPPDVSDPDDEREILCLDLEDGSEQWRRAREGALYVGAVHKQTVLLVGSQGIECIGLANGETLWSIPLGTPSGRGVRSGSLYHLPLATGEIATIDLDGGTLLARSPVRSGGTLGNLVAVGGRLVSQTATELRSFRPRDEVLRQLTDDLADDPNNPAALAVRGEFRLHDGETEQGLADFRSVLEQTDDPRSRQLLISTLLEGLRSSFAGYRTHVDELDRLTVGRNERSEFLVTYARGLLDVSEPVAAFKQYVRVLAENDQDRPFAHLSDGRHVRRDRFVQAQIARIYEAAPGERRQNLDRLLADALSTTAEGKVGELHDDLAAALPHLRETNSRPNDRRNAGEASGSSARLEARLVAELRRVEPDRRAAAAADLVEFYARHQRAEPVEQLLHKLETVWGDAPCRENMTGAEWAVAQRERGPVSDVLQSAVAWFDAEVTVEEGPIDAVPETPIRFEGPTDPLVATHLYLSDRNGRQVIVQDGIGRRISGGVLPVHTSGGSIQPSSKYVMQRGHRAVVFLDTQFKLLDLIDGKPRVVLDEMLIDVEPVANPGFRMMHSTVTRQDGFRGQVRWSNDPGENGNIGPLNDGVFCYVKGRTLHAHDPFTGERYWTVEDAPYGVEIFADSDYVLLVPVGKFEVHIYRALDGEKLGLQRLPRDVVKNRRGADWGRLFLRHFQDADGTSSIAMYDPIDKTDVWTRKLSNLSLWAPLDGRDLCLLDADGRMTLLDAETGRVLQEAIVQVPTAMTSMSVLSLPNQWIVTTYRRPPADAPTQLAQIRRSESAYHVMNGPVTAFQRETGKSLWSRVIESQSLSVPVPARWPILPLSAVVNGTPQAVGQRLIPNQFRRVQILDRRTGEAVYSVEAAIGRGQFGTHWSVSRSEPQLRLRCGETTLQVTFRPPSAERSEAPSADSTADPAATDEADQPDSDP